ncbi:fumarylacetoacetate hydrolase [Marinomonas sp. M1K-6]|uniref:Fumarylacetoacetate hydrolase n=1 Tax=Marinomonas profundi TaxID=2726122 RepID=A0A847R344_9GAMM|nr:fumarylacetoacetate hydrolase family protein [Marinomonas profundi]NLQ18282.1 fumarylacetoacetate hydrolase [Marinomonas profundi]UDV02345.1 fumarylacetoacetate hydrolase family protein [Marinomonas profundi]
MKFATLPNGSLDGRLVVVSKDLTKAVDATLIAPNLLSAVQNWQEKSADLQALYDLLNAGKVDFAFDFDPSACLAPLPRSPQWLDASAFINHGKLMEEAFNTKPIPDFETIPVIYQGASDDFQGPTVDIPMPSEADGIDFEGEFGVVMTEVPMAVSVEKAANTICLIVQINDWSLRAFGPREMATGFGFIQAKPSSSFAPVAVTPDELGDAWCNGRVNMHLNVTWNDQRFGEPHGSEMNFSFPQLVAHAARTRKLTAGCIIGSGTVSNKSREAGSACIAERRVIEKIDLGEIRTPFMRFGDKVRMQAKFDDGRDGPFGVIEQKVIAN